MYHCHEPFHKVNSASIPMRYGKILLVNPHETEAYSLSNPPLGLLYLAGTLLKHGFDVRVVDGYVEGRNGIAKTMEHYRPDLVGITCMTPGRKKALEIAKMTKDMDSGVKTVMGGSHPTIMYRQILKQYPFVDYIALGEGEITCLELAQGVDPSKIHGVAYRNRDSIVRTPPRKCIENLDNVPFPAWNLVDLRQYPPMDNGIFRGIDLSKEPCISVVFSRGCTGHCNFCSAWWIWRGWRCRSPKNMGDEIELLHKGYGIRRISFADDAMTVDREKTIKLCDEIISRKLNIVFHLTTRVDSVDAVVLKKLHGAGCYGIAFGVETGSPILLKKIGKGVDIGASERAIKLAKKAGLRTAALMIIGNVGETSETIDETLNFLKRAQPDEVSFTDGLWIFPGTRLYQEVKRKGFIDDEFWLTDEPFKVYTLEHSLDELAEFGKRISAYQTRFQRWNSEIRMAIRGGYLMTLLNRRVRKKLAT